MKDLRDLNCTVLNLRTTTWQKYGAVPRRARIEGSWIVASLNSRLESNKEEEESARCSWAGRDAGAGFRRSTPRPPRPTVVKPVDSTSVILAGYPVNR